MIPLGRAEIRDHRRKCLGVRRKKIHIFSGLLHASAAGAVRPPRTGIERVGDVHAAGLRPGGYDPHVVRPVERLAFAVFDQHRDFQDRGFETLLGIRRPRRKGRGNSPEFIFLVGAGNQVAFIIEAHSVGVARGMQKGQQPPLEWIRGISVKFPFQDPIVGLIDEKNISVLVAGCPLRECQFQILRPFR